MRGGHRTGQEWTQEQIQFVLDHYSSDMSPQEIVNATGHTWESIRQFASRHHITRFYKREFRCEHCGALVVTDGIKDKRRLFCSPPCARGRWK